MSKPKLNTLPVYRPTTAVPFTRTWTPFENPSANDLNTDIRDNLLRLLSPPRCALSSSVSQVPPADISTPLMFDTELVDSDNMWSSAFPSRIYFRTAGLYQVRFSFVNPYEAAVPATCFLGLSISYGGQWPSGQEAHKLISIDPAGSGASTASTCLGAGGLFQFDQDDYMEVFWLIPGGLPTGPQFTNLTAIRIADS